MNYLKPLQMMMTSWYNRSVAMMPLDRSRLLMHLGGRVIVFMLCHVWPFLLFSPLKVCPHQSLYNYLGLSLQRSPRRDRLSLLHAVLTGLSYALHR